MVGLLGLVCLLFTHRNIQGLYLVLDPVLLCIQVSIPPLGDAATNQGIEILVRFIPQGLPHSFQLR